MSSLRRHVYATLLTLSGLLILFGSFVVTNRAAVTPSARGNTWGSGVLLGTNPVTDVTRAETPDTTLGAQNHAYISPFGSRNEENTALSSEDVFNWDTLQKSIAKSPTPSKETTSTGFALDAYTFIPTGLFSMDTAKKELSASERALFEYGNGIGAVIQGYESSHSNQAAILTDNAQDRTNVQKKAAVVRLGADLVAVGDSIDAVATAPTQLVAAGSELAAAYRLIGTKLALIPNTASDDDFVKAILAYNLSAESFVQSYVKVALIFQANGISFAKNEPGSVFMMPSGSGIQ